MSYRARYGYNNQSKFVQTFNSMSNATKITLAAGAVGLAGAAAWMLWPDRHETLAEWNSDYMNYCHSEYAESDFSDYSRVRNRVRDTLSDLSRVSPAGARLANELEQNDYVFCYGERYNEEVDDIYYNRWIGTYFVEWDVTDRNVAEYLFNSEIRDFAGDVMWRENEYITEHAVLWNRARVAALQTAMLDATYAIYSNPGYGEPGPFEGETWQRFEQNVQTRNAAIAFREHMQSEEYADIREARLAAFKSVLQDSDAIYEEDYHFLSWYKNEVDEDTYPVTYPCGESTCTRLQTDYPASWIHSEEIHPDTLVALSYAFFPEDGFIDIEDSYDILNDAANWRPTSTRTQFMFNAAVRNAEWHCRGHYTEGDMSLGTGMDLGYIEGTRFRPSID